MISKQIFLVQNIGTNETINVNGFLTGIIDIEYNESNNSALNIYGGTNSTVDTSYRPPITVNGVQQESTIILSQQGKYRLTIDLTNCKYIKVVRAEMANSNVKFCCTPYPVSESVDLYAGKYELIYDVRGKKQIDGKVAQIYKSASSGSRYVRFYQSEDGITWTNFTSVNTEWGVSVGGYAEIDKELNIYANVESTNYVKIKFDTDQKDIYKANIELHDSYVEGKSFTLNTRSNSTPTTNAMIPLLKGYRYVKIEPLGLTLTTGFATLRVNVIENGLPYVPQLLNRKYEIIRTPYNIYTNGVVTTDRSKFQIPLFGNCSEGGVVIDFIRPLTNGIRFVFSKSSDSDISYGAFRITLNNSVPKVEEEPTICDKTDYTIKECKIQNIYAERDAFGADVIEYTNDKILYYQYGYHGFVWEINFDSDTVEAFITGEKIKYAYLLPFDGNNNVGTLRLPNRIVVFTNKNRVLYNASSIYDYGHFKEAKVVNPYKKWQAVNDANDVDSVHKYFPVLKDYDYDQFENRGAAVVQGTAAGTLLLDFPTPSDVWNRTTWCNFSRSNKVAVFGNYNSSKTEPIVIATTDGGKTWKVVTWFGFVTDYNASAGNPIDLSPISAQSSYIANSLKLCIREYRVPTEETPEPENTFIIDTDKQVNVTSFGTDSSGNTVVNLASAKDYGDGSPVCYFVNNSPGNIWDTICNNDMDASGTNSNGVFFRLKKVSTTQYILTSNVGNPYEKDLLCYHIHCVNRTCAGFVISTGESYTTTKYEGGMLYYLAQNYNNGSNPIPNGVDALLNKTNRITSSNNGVNRACGAYISNDHADPTVIYASDESFYTTGKRDVSIPGRTVAIKNVPTGIFAGKLSDIDDQSKFDCICETRGTMLSLFEWFGHFIADGHFESICISKDGRNWHIDMNTSKNRINGADSDGNLYFGNYKVIFKG